MTRALSGIVLTLFGCILLYSGIDGANTTRPAACLDKFAVVPHHTLCLADRTQHPLTDADRDEIVNAHNTLREAVDPPAADMMKMYYSKELEEEAQIWAENCEYHHEHDRRQRNFPGDMSVGQNIAMFSRSSTWTRVSDLWAADKEKYHFKYGDSNLRSSHYTQQIWSSSSLIGCGMAHCKTGVMYVCNYGPGGNHRDTHHHIVPYKEATSGHGGSDCPSKHGAHSTLCNCQGAYCKNAGTMDPDTCSCTCKSGPKYADDKCALSCDPNSDRTFCGRSPFVASSCPKYSNVPVDCPWMCHTCPFSGPNYVEGSVSVTGDTIGQPVG